MTAGAAPGKVGQCEPGIGIGLVEFPRGSADPRARTYVIDRVKPGATFSRQFQVCNGTREAVTLQLYAGSAVVKDGGFTILDGRGSTELSSWVRVSPASVTIPSGQRILAKAAFAVPLDAADGERYGVILAELPAAPGGQGVSTASRVGIRIYLAVGEGEAPVSDFSIDSLQASRRSDGRPIVSAVVTNTGARALDLVGDLRLTEGPGGLSAGPFPAVLGTTLAPGDSSPVTIVLDEAIRGGPWLATLSLRSGLLDRAATARITFPDATGASAPAVTAKPLPLAKDPSVVIPIAVTLIGLLLLILIVVGYLTSRRRARERPAA